MDVQDVSSTGRSYEETAGGRERYLSQSLATFTAYRRPLVLTHGEGQYVWDSDSNRYLDCLAQNLCISVGYAHKAVNDAVAAQMAKIQHVTTMYYHEMPVAFAERLIGKFPEGDWVVHFVNSGAEAIDIATLVARLYTGNHDILTLRSAYHGMHFGTMSATGLALCHQPLPASPGFVQVANPDQYRGIFGEGVEPYVAEIVNTIDTATPGQIAGMMIEPIQGYGGVIPMPAGYMKRAAETVREAGGVVIVDEVQTGFGRTGAGFWGLEAHDVTPDIIVMSKGIGNGFPLAAIVMRRDIAAAMAERKFFNTYGSNPMACAAGLAVLDAIEAEGLQQNAADTGAKFEAGMRRVAEKHAAVGDVRGSGLMLGIEFVSDKASRTPDENAAEAVQEGLRERGVIVGRSGRYKNVLRINPPLCVDEEDAVFFEKALDSTLGSLA